MSDNPTFELLCGDDFEGRCSICKTKLDPAVNAQQLLQSFNQHLSEVHPEVARAAQVL